MNDSTHANAMRVYALPEESFQTLHELRNLMFLMATTTHVVSVEEKTIHLRLPRAMLSQCFRHVGVQLAKALIGYGADNEGTNTQRLDHP
jgi:hypothetical protein